MNGPSAQFVRDSIAQDTVVIFSKSYCPYCKMAKESPTDSIFILLCVSNAPLQTWGLGPQIRRVFNKVKTSFNAIELDSRDDGDEIQSILGEMTGAKTVPRVFIKGQCVGGGTDVKGLYESGKLEEMLA